MFETKTMESEQCTLTSKADSLAEKAKELGLKYILPVISSLTSDCRGCLVPVRSAGSLENNGFGIYALGHFAMENTDPEQYGVPDPSTLIKLPWQPDIGFVACNVHHKGAPCQQCPRIRLDKLQAQAKEAGFVMKCGIEPEFILLKKDSHEELDPSQKDLVVYHKPRLLLDKLPFIHECLTTMEKLGWEPYQAEHEAVTNQFELNYGFTDTLASADRHFFLRFMIKELAVKNGFRATFMPLPFPGKPMGSGLHLNISLWSTDTDKSMFPDEDSDIGISEIAQNFIAGVIAHARALTAILCPTVNSYKRLHASTLTAAGPVVSWALESRYPMIRIPANNRMELRIGDGAGNPYLIQAAVLAAGLHGITAKLPLEEKTRMQQDVTKSEPPEHLQRLPKTLDEACNYLENDTVLREYLGDELVNGFLKLKREEWKSFMKTVTPWEIEHADEY